MGGVGMNREYIYRAAFESVQDYLAQSTEDIPYLRGLFKSYETLLAQFDGPSLPPEKEIQEQAEDQICAIEKPEPKRHGKGGPRTKITHAEVYRMKVLADNGYSLYEIAAKTKRSYAAVYRILKEYQPRKTIEPPKGIIDWIRELAADGKGVEEIADQVGYTTSIVIKYAGGGAA